MGSRVIRGNVLVIPIEHSILYVSPLYLRARSGQLPELKRVIATYGNRVVMAGTLRRALTALFQGAPKRVTPLVASAARSVVSKASSGSAAVQALDDYDRALQELRAGDWSDFGANIEKLRPLLEILSHGEAGR